MVQPASEKISSWYGTEETWERLVCHLCQGDVTKRELILWEVPVSVALRYGDYLNREERKRIDRLYRHWEVLGALHGVKVSMPHLVADERPKRKHKIPVAAQLAAVGFPVEKLGKK